MPSQDSGSHYRSLVAPPDEPDPSTTPEPGEDHPSEALRPLTPGGRFLRRTVLRSATPEERAAALATLFYEGDARLYYLERFAVLIVLSASIASLGLMQDSAAVVIGAMVVAPLMNPILALGAAVVHGRPGRAAEALATVAAGAVLAIATGWVCAAVAGFGLDPGALPGEVLARTSPGLLDLGVALAAGAAGGYVLARPEANSALPGVGIAVALVPPLGTVGICFQVGRPQLGEGALLLFLTNFACIVFAAALVFIVVGIVSPDVRRLATHQIRRGLLLAAVSVVLVAVPLTRHTYQQFLDEDLNRATIAAVAEWDPDVTLVGFEADRREPTSTVHVVVAGQGEAEPAWVLADLIAADIGAPVEVEVEFRPTTVSAAGVTGDRAPTLRVFTPYLGTDLERFRAAVERFERTSGRAVTVIGSGDFEADLMAQVAAGEAPDIALIPQPGLFAELVDGGAVVPLNAEAAEATSDVAPELRALAERDGATYGAWYRLTNKSLVWYRPDALEALGLAPPSTWDELEALTDAAAESRTTPWCLTVADFGASGWAGTDWIEQFFVLREGIDAYDAWVRGDIAFTDERVADAFQAFGAIATDPRQVYGGPRRVLGTSISRAADPLRDDPPGCLLYRQGNGLPGAPTAGDGVEGDLDVFPVPALDDAIGAPAVIGGDLAVALTEREGVADLLAFLASADGGMAWVEQGGLLSPHREVPLDAYGDVRDRAAAEHLRSSLDGAGVVFDASDQMPAEIGTGAFWIGVLDYLGGTPLDEVLAQIEAARPAG
jgi:alpha-glucoside transport system substrate-binding protein